SSRSWELCFRCLTSVNCYPLTRFTHWYDTSQNPICCSQLLVIMVEDKVITLGPNELPNLVSSYRLDSRNYLQWAQYIRTTLKGRKKLSHIEGNDLPRDDPKNKPKLYYYETLNELWIELDQYQGLKMCKADSVAYTRIIEKGRIFKFLHGLNFEYNPIRVQILGKEKLPSLSEVFFIVRSEETRRSIMLDKGNSNIGSAMVIGKGAIKRSTSKEKPFTKRHTKDTCYKHYGKENVLERMGENKGSTQMWVNQTTSNKENRVEHPSTFKEEMDRLQVYEKFMLPDTYIVHKKGSRIQNSYIQVGQQLLLITTQDT
ncbi:hypothetical protein CR513_53130, partial [Mucuna pruriens]